MGLRQPSKTEVFFAQMKAGTARQKKARENLKNPQQSALCGSATAGTEMVAATTESQQNANKALENTAQSASKDLVAGNVGTQSTTMIAGTPSQPPSTQPPSTQPPSPVTFTGGISGVTSNSIPIVKANEEGSNLDESIATENQLKEEIANIQNNLDKLTASLNTASDRDVAEINAERTRLTDLLTKYQNMITEGKLGKIAGPSTFETNMEIREQLLGQQGNEIGKLQELFGPNWNKDKYGGLSSQIYGKDLELLQGQAAEAIAARKKSKEEGAEAFKQYDAQLKTSKKGFEEKLDTATQRVELLKKSPDELKATTKTEVEKLFGVELADKLFDFDDKGYVSNTQSELVKQTYRDAKKAQETALGLQETETKTAQTNLDDTISNIKSDLFGPDGKSGKIASFQNVPNDWKNTAQNLLNKIEDERGSWFGGWSGMSKDSYIARDLAKIATDTQIEQQSIIDNINKAINSKNNKDIVRFYGELQALQTRSNQLMKNKASELSDDGKTYFNHITTGIKEDSSGKIYEIGEV